MSRARIVRSILNAQVLLNGSPITKPNVQLTPGDQIDCLILEEPAHVHLLAKETPFDVCYEDEHLIVVNKPAGLAIHPGNGEQDNTLVNGLLHKFTHLAETRDRMRPGIVHRLDKDTTGLLLVAKDSRTHTALSAMIAERSVVRVYWAILLGVPTPSSGTIETFLKRNPKDRTKMQVSHNGKRAITHYRTLEVLSAGRFSLVEFKLDTGRTHQIRVHAKHIGHPVVGDAKYEGGTTIAQRQMLHAKRLTFNHPISGQLIDIDSKLPEDMMELLCKSKS